MLKIKNFLITNKILAVCLAILMSVSFVFASDYFSTSESKTANCAWYQSRTYYSDSSLTTQVGYKVWFCDGLIGRSGQTTIYYTTDYCECWEEPPY